MEEIKALLALDSRGVVSEREIADLTLGGGGRRGQVPAQKRKAGKSLASKGVLSIGQQHALRFCDPDQFSEVN